MKRGEVYWVAFDPSIGSEIQKTRPAVIVSRDASNRNVGRVTVVPFTQSIANVFIGEAIVHLSGKMSKAVADQIATVDKTRVRDRIGWLSPPELKAVEEAIRAHLEL
ncbi:growth inhibitor PemK [Cephaloticoccus primus]|uniref:mRNA interferase n=1 Tax=Cephaloticoccus primus TaxID=1548207 RepID=A0A139SSP7_9BACT|nr:type II toxin-antitoxin system PemK/MazF family toxin [Cephaloticoccus primus]KXU37586.1 growth inhibitor PemK [Cephaloticoccus primus]